MRWDLNYINKNTNERHAEYELFVAISEEDCVSQTVKEIAMNNKKK